MVKVLILDYSKSMRNTLRERLEYEGFSAEAVENESQAEDLFHRICVVPLRVPPLRNRKEDIPLLAEHFLKSICEGYALPCKTMTVEAVGELQKMPWSGNVRELRNVVERLGILSGDTITADDVVRYAFT